MRQHAGPLPQPPAGGFQPEPCWGERATHREARTAGAEEAERHMAAAPAPLSPATPPAPGLSCGSGEDRVLFWGGGASFACVPPPPMAGAAARVQQLIQSPAPSSCPAPRILQQCKAIPPFSLDLVLGGKKVIFHKMLFI